MKKGTKPEEITVAEWLKELEAINAIPDEGYTTNELAEAWGITVQVARQRLAVAKKAGLLKITRVKRETLSGLMSLQPAYILLRP